MAQGTAHMAQGTAHMAQGTAHMAATPEKPHGAGIFRPENP